jgi:hypothetical protein
MLAVSGLVAVNRKPDFASARKRAPAKESSRPDINAMPEELAAQVIPANQRRSHCQREIGAAARRPAPQTSRQIIENPRKRAGLGHK